MGDQWSCCFLTFLWRLYFFTTLNHSFNIINSRMHDNTHVIVLLYTVYREVKYYSCECIFLWIELRNFCFVDMLHVSLNNRVLRMNSDVKPWKENSCRFCSGWWIFHLSLLCYKWRLSSPQEGSGQSQWVRGRNPQRLKWKPVRTKGACNYSRAILFYFMHVRAFWRNLWWNRAWRLGLGGLV